MFRLRNSWLAWQFDRAVGLYGRYVQGELDQRDSKGRPKRSLQDIIENGMRRREGTFEDLVMLLGTGE